MTETGLKIYLTNRNNDKVLITKKGDYITAEETITIDNVKQTTTVNHNYKPLQSVLDWYYKYGFCVGSQ